MYGVYDSYTIYGIKEVDNRMIDKKWFSGNYPDLYMYDTSITRLHSCGIVYGVYVRLNEQTGICDVSEEDKILVNELYDRINKFYKNEKRRIGFFTGILGDDVSRKQFYIYNPDINENDEE